MNMKKVSKDHKDNYMVIRITDADKKEYMDYCDKFGYTMSKRILAIIKEDAKGNVNIVK
jgi:hypothetical protein